MAAIFDKSGHRWRGSSSKTRIETYNFTMPSDLLQRWRGSSSKTRIETQGGGAGNFADKWLARVFQQNKD